MSAIVPACGVIFLFIDNIGLLTNEIYHCPLYRRVWLEFVVIITTTMWQLFHSTRMRNFLKFVCENANENTTQGQGLEFGGF